MKTNLGNASPDQPRTIITRPPAVVAPPSAPTVVAQPQTVPHGTPPPQPIPAPVRARRDSAWDTPGSAPGSNDPTGLHTQSARPHPGVRINQYEMIKMIGEGGMG